tara:strand:+ start:2824 stop:3600 length:777 start_codon:yes stop_codon:yes gene_type:complete
MIADKFIKNTHALLLREINSRAGNNPLSLLWVILEPIVHVGILVAIKLLLRLDMVENIDNTLFVISGVVPFFAFQYGMTSVLYAPRSNRGLLSFPTIKTLHIMAARAFLEYAIMLLVLILLLGACRLAGHDFDIKNPLAVVFYFTLMVIFGASMGMFYAPLIGRFHFFDVFLSILRRVMYFTSGVFISLSFLSIHTQEILALNPVVHMLALFRQALFTDHIVSDVFLNWQYAIGFTMITLFAGLYMIRRYESWAYETP